MDENKAPPLGLTDHTVPEFGPLQASPKFADDPAVAHRQYPALARRQRLRLYLRQPVFQA